jgi:5-(aminomethyl)-3-furanmethanol phosphate kinase
MASGLTVVKIGGSVAQNGKRLRCMLAGLAACREPRLVIVPGGGVLADAVRSAQGALGFDDALAHRLALDAMGQMAQVFAALGPGLTVVSSLDAIGAALQAGAVPVWDPAALRTGHVEIPETWNVTSDSLALWLAAALQAERCVLVKSVDAPPSAGWPQLARLGIVDTAFPGFAIGYTGEIVIHGPSAGDDPTRFLADEERAA